MGTEDVGEGNPKAGEDVLFKLILQEQNVTFRHSISFNGQCSADAHSRFSWLQIPDQFEYFPRYTPPFRVG